MDREAALRSLAASDSDARLRAARALRTLAVPADEPALRARRRVESVPWVRAALEQALVQISSGTPRSDGSAADADVPNPDLRAEYMSGLQLATDRIVHELRSIVGTLRYWAQKENSRYEGSETERQVERLRRCLEAIDFLSKVSRAPSSNEFDLAVLIGDEIASIEERGVPVEMIGPSPLLVRGDSGVIGLVVRNSLANAVEASATPAIHVNWGETPTEFWLAVFDRGPGLPRDAEALFDFGSSTKKDHVGAGLAIVAHAGVVLQGDVALTEEADGTTKFEFRWPRPDGGLVADTSR